MTIPTIDPADVGATGLAWLLFSYGYILCYASNLISEGSDLLLLVPSLAGLVGGVVLPFLGAVPDGTIMLFSGLGDIEKAQETLSVGVGALAGSTIMLLTVPWALSVYQGRVDFDDDNDLEPNYKQPKLTKSSFLDTGVALSNEVNQGARMMMLTTLPYFLIQIPAFFLSGDRETVSEGEKYWAMAGFVICISFFVLYLYTQVKMSNDTIHKMRRIAVIKDTLKKGAVSLRGALREEVINLEKKETKRKTSFGSMSEETPLTNGGGLHHHQQPSTEISELLKGILGEAFRAYDIDGDGNLNMKEFKIFLTDFHESINDSTVAEVFTEFDSDKSGTIEFDEFIAACYVLIKKSNEKNDAVENSRHAPVRQARRATTIMSENLLDDEDDDEDEEVPEDLTALSPEDQQRAIIRRAFSMLIVGTGIVLIFSDPMVEVLSEIAARCNIPPFYVSFILAPVAANASEVIASQYYASKKTRKTITVALTALEGAASMNNTFCLSIFMGLIYFRGLAWQFSAETLAIVSVQLVMYIYAQRSKMSTATGFVVLSFFPLSVILVALLEYCGLD